MHLAALRLANEVAADAESAAALALAGLVPSVARFADPRWPDHGVRAETGRYLASLAAGPPSAVQLLCACQVSSRPALLTSLPCVCRGDGGLTSEELLTRQHPPLSKAAVQSLLVRCRLHLTLSMAFSRHILFIMYRFAISRHCDYFAIATCYSYHRHLSWLQGLATLTNLVDNVAPDGGALAGVACDSLWAALQAGGPGALVARCRAAATAGLPMRLVLLLERLERQASLARQQLPRSSPTVVSVTPPFPTPPTPLRCS